jgi:hypothetical protein
MPVESRHIRQLLSQTQLSAPTGIPQATISAVKSDRTHLGVAASGNALGWSLAQWQQSSEAERAPALQAARVQLKAAGAHGVVDSVADLPHAIEAIEQGLDGGAGAV